MTSKEVGKSPFGTSTRTEDSEQESLLRPTGTKDQSIDVEMSGIKAAQKPMQSQAVMAGACFCLASGGMVR